MVGLSKDDALITVLLRHLEAHRFPVILSIQEKVVRGKVLDDWEVGFLEESVEEIRKTMPLVNHHPELQGLYTRSAAMFLEISRKAYQNEESLPTAY